MGADTRTDKTKSSIAMFGLAALFVVAAVLLLRGPGADVADPAKGSAAPPAEETRVINRVGGNAILVNDQDASGVVSVAVADLVENGFVAIHETDGEKFGEILGISPFFVRGGYADFTIPLTRPLVSGTELIAVLYRDNGDHSFSVTRDRVIYDGEGSPLSMRFTVR